jgi:hypothetical protein
VKHFDEASWVDFARNLVSGDARMAMQEHIDKGCEKCAATLQVWRNLLPIAEQESGFVPPNDVVRVVKSFAVATEASRGFRLLFDSNLQPITAGIRGSVSARQFLYETDQYYIDFRLESPREAPRACLVGQVLSRGGVESSASGVAVRVQEGKRSVAETTANRFGEFQLEFEVTNNLCVSISRDRDSEIILPLYGIHAKPAEPEDLG